MSDSTRIVGDYLEGWNRKDVAAFAAVLAPDVRFKGPLAQIEGRDPFLAAVTRMFPMVEKLELRALFTEEDRALAVYDFVCAPPVGCLRTAEMIGIKDGLIVSSELFFDTAPLTSAQPQRAAA